VELLNIDISYLVGIFKIWDKATGFNVKFFVCRWKIYP